MRDPNDHTKCKATEGHASILFARRHDIRKISIDHHEMSVIVNNTKSATALDFVFRTGMIFWSDVAEQKIYKYVWYGFFGEREGEGGLVECRVCNFGLFFSRVKWNIDNFVNFENLTKFSHIWKDCRNSKFSSIIFLFLKISEISPVSKMSLNLILKR